MSYCFKNIKGTQDFYGTPLSKRTYIIDTIKNIFSLHQFDELQTPAMENIHLLTGKYGDEGEQLLYRILNSGDFMAGIEEKLPLVNQISEKGLRYDLTVPMMRFVANNVGSIIFPWKRFQIQPVWRADRPQKGRFREFTQCDIDIVGSDSILNEVELISIVRKVIKKLGLSNVKLYINHIGIIKDILISMSLSDKFLKIFGIIDKLDKVSIEKVLEELQGIGATEDCLKLIYDLNLLKENYNFRDTIDYLKSINKKFNIENSNVENLEKLFMLLKNAGVEENFVILDPILARGLSYYTKIVFELKPVDKSIGSMVGGGRYDNMIKNLLDTKLPLGVVDSGIGLSFGIDRISSYMEENNLFPSEIFKSEKSLIVPLIEESMPYCLALLSKLTNSNIPSEIFTKSFKLKTALDYANKKNISKVLIVGEEEMTQNKVLVKDMITGLQKSIGVDEVISSKTE